MPSGPRIRTDNVFGTLTDNPLTSGATTMNSAGLANLAAVSSAHALIVIDPLRSAGAPECVIVTAHTGSATSATITRGAYGTSARQHASGVLWVHAPSVEDFIRIVTASTRPSDPYEGQKIYETDTDYYMGYSGSAWEYGTKLGAWDSWTPTLTQNNVAVTKTTTYARYRRVGRGVDYQVSLACTGAGTAAQAIRVGLPPPLAVVTGNIVNGVGYVFDASANLAYRCFVLPLSTTQAFLYPTDGTVSDVLGVTGFTAALASGDVISYSGTYEATT